MRCELSTSTKASDLFNHFLVRLFSIPVNNWVDAGLEIAQFVWRVYRAYTTQRTIAGRARLFLQTLRSEEVHWMLNLLRDVAGLDPRAGAALRALDLLGMLPGGSRLETVEGVLRDAPSVFRSVISKLTPMDSASDGNSRGSWRPHLTAVPSAA